MTTEFKSPLLASVAAAVGASVCCVGPLVLLTLGVGGAWVSNLTALEPIRPVLIGMTFVFLGLAFRRLYLLPQVCAPDTACAQPATLPRQRMVFWVATVTLLILLAIPSIAPMFF
jgi:mercuric ion transport protein